MASSRHVRRRSRRFVRVGSFFGRSLSKYRGAHRLGRRKSTRANDWLCSEGGNDWLCSEVRMVLFSRSFVRKPAISIATTALVAATSFALAEDSTRAYPVRGTRPIQYVADRPDYSNEHAFLSENDAAMNKMMADMTIKPTGDVDRDFVAMMVPHHQGAVEMAKAELKYGHNELLRRLAKVIIANQQREITVMRLAVDDERPLRAGHPKK